MSKKLHVFKELDRNCASPECAEFVKRYINNLIKSNEQLVARVHQLKKEKHKLFKKKY